MESSYLNVLFLNALNTFSSAYRTFVNVSHRLRLNVIERSCLNVVLYCVLNLSKTYYNLQFKLKLNVWSTLVNV